jgi:hypothetical protein
VTPDKGPHIGLTDELHVNHPRPAKDHHEGPQRPGPPPGGPILEQPEVHLGALSGLGLEPDGGFGLRQRPEGFDVVLENGLPTAVAEGSHLTKQDFAVENALGHSQQDMLLERIQ